MLTDADLQRSGLDVLREPPRCSNCRFWHRIEYEGSPGTPAKRPVGERAGWGECCVSLYCPDVIRTKGFTETRETFWCVLWRSKRGDLSTESNEPKGDLA